MTDHDTLISAAVLICCALGFGLALVIIIDAIHQTRRDALELNRTRPARLRGVRS